MSSSDLHITYMVWGLPVSTLGMLPIAAECGVHDLRTMISEQLDLRGLPFALHKVCRQIPRAVEYLEEVLDLNTFPAIFPNDQLSDIFSEPLDRSHLHFVIKVFDQGWMAQRVQYIELFCWMWSGTVKDVVQIKISRKENVANLKGRIKEAQRSLETVELDHIKLYDVSIPITDAVKLKDSEMLPSIVNKAELEPFARLYKVFPSPRAGHIHVVVYVSRPELSIQNLAARREEHYKYLNKCSPSIVPSTTAQPKRFREFQDKSNLAVHCNRGSTSKATPPLPLTLLHPVFGEFLDDCQTIATTAHDHCFARDFMGEMRVLYAQEETKGGEPGRAPTVRRLFKEWGVALQQTTIETPDGRKFQTDGDLSDPVTGCRYAILEVKNEIGSGNADPYAQASLYYQQAFKEMLSKTSSVLPCLLVLVFGPYIGFAGAVWNIHATTEILSVIPLFHDPKYPSNVQIQVVLSRHLVAMKKAVQTLKDYYGKSLPPRDPSPRQLFPHPTFYFHDGQPQTFEYRAQIDSTLIFHGRLPDTQQDDLWIKFVRSYSFDAHKFCEGKGHAPELLGRKDLPGNWIMVAMKNLTPDYLPLNAAKTLVSASLVDDIRKTIGELHKEGKFVHGDLRDVNIMVRKQDKSKFMIVDWDWAGKIEEVRYPLNVNHAVKRPAGVTDGEPILPEHDLAMLDYMAQDYFESDTIHKRALSSASQELSRKVPRTDPE